MQTEALTLEQQLKDLVVTHDLTYLAIHVYRRADGTPYLGASAQGGGECAFGEFHHEDTLADKHVASAIERLNAKRHVAVEVAPLPAMQVAA